MLEICKYIEFKEGNIPLILSVPHGGIMEFDSISQRSTGILGIDKGTIELAKDLGNIIHSLSEAEEIGYKYPFLIYSNIRRSKIDFNRKESEAYSHNSFIAREIYSFYHNKIQEWIEYNLKEFNRSMLLDIHGFEKKNRPQGFRDVEIILGTNNLKSFFPEPIPKRNWEKNIRGKIIQTFLQLNIPIAPGHPRRREYVLTGGYITKKYGASQIKFSHAMQIEFSDNIRIYNEDLRELVLDSIANILVKEYLFNEI
jgi:N-formylglutamate amidohydrolase